MAAGGRAQLRLARSCCEARVRHHCLRDHGQPLVVVRRRTQWRDRRRSAARASAATTTQAPLPPHPYPHGKTRASAPPPATADAHGGAVPRCPAPAGAPPPGRSHHLQRRADRSVSQQRRGILRIGLGRDWTASVTSTVTSRLTAAARPRRGRSPPPTRCGSGAAPLPSHTCTCRRARATLGGAVTVQRPVDQRATDPTGG